MADAADRAAARAALVETVEAAGYPAELGELLANELGGAASMRRMAAYVRAARPTSVAEIADELVAIVEWRDRWAARKMSERAEAAVTAFYNREG